MARGLRHDGFTVTSLSTNSIDHQETLSMDPDVIIVNISQLSPEDESRWLEGSRALAPIIAILTMERLTELHLIGAVDDFVVSPSSAVEIAARVRRIIRQQNVTDGKQDMIQCGDLVIDPTRYEVMVGQQPVSLTYKEYELLRFLATHPNKVFTRDALLNQVWGYDYYGGARTVDVHIRRLRSKLEDATHSFIETVRNVGYRLRESRAAPGTPHLAGN
ncbi:MAG: response regulator transcription factor [Chloroflexi bacterium]|nr:response regulator transcription factor [Chloroflexota bacterium]